MAANPKLEGVGGVPTPLENKAIKPATENKLYKVVKTYAGVKVGTMVKSPNKETTQIMINKGYWE